MPGSLRFPPWPLVLAHCLLSSCLLFSQAELQSFCSQHDINRGGEGRQLLCHSRPYPPLPPPPPPPPPPPTLLSMAPEASAPVLSSWWMEIIVVGTTGSAVGVFLLLTVFIFYKAIKRSQCGDESTSVRRQSLWEATVVYRLGIITVQIPLHHRRKRGGFTNTIANRSPTLSELKPEPTTDTEPEPTLMPALEPMPEPPIVPEPKNSDLSDQVRELTTSSVAVGILAEYEGTQCRRSHRLFSSTSVSRPSGSTCQVSTMAPASLNSVMGLLPGSPAGVPH